MAHSAILALDITTAPSETAKILVGQEKGEQMGGRRMGLSLAAIRRFVDP